KSFRTRLCQIPSLVNCCTLDWYDPWSSNALLQVAHRLINNWNVPLEYKVRMAEECVYMHVSVEKASTQFLTELKRHNYTTATSYLQLLNSYDQTLKEMDELIAIRQQKLSNRLSILERTNKEVEAMKTQLIAIQPRLEQQQKDIKAIRSELTVQQKEVEGKEEVVRGEDAIVTQQTNEVEALAQDAQNELNKTILKYNAAINAVQSLDKIDISEDKSYSRPSELVMFVMASVCLLFNQPQIWEQAIILKEK
ncbi:MAG: putative dynein heavy chain, partial [Streblomastix strix]